MEKQYIDVIKPKITQQTLYQLTQLKVFVDASLKEAVSKNFDNDQEKIRYLVDALYNIRDFVLTQSTDNSARLSIIDQIEKLEKEIEVGNDLEQQTEELEKNSNESQELDLES
jgi:hypothetical protein